MNTNKHGIMTVEGRAVFSIAIRIENPDCSKELLSQEWDIEKSTIEEAMRIYEKYPEEVQRDIVKAQIVDARDKYELRKNALEKFLTECHKCSDGRYEWSHTDFENSYISDPKLVDLECSNCSHDPL